MGQWESTRRPKGIIGDDADCEELDLCPGWWTTPKVAQKEDTLEPAVPSDLTPNYFVLSVPYTGFGKGVNTLKVVAIDAGGNRDPSPAYFTFTVMDATAYSEVADQFKWTFKMTEGSTGTSMKTFAFKNNLNHAYCIDSEC